MKPKVSIIIVNYNAGPVLERCLESLVPYLTHPTAPCEVIVVDNQSVDGSPERVKELFPTMKLVQSGGNLFFTGRVNRGQREATGDYIWILGPDTVVIDDPLPRMLAFLEKNPTVGAVSGRLYHADGRLQPTCSTDYTLGFAFLTYTVLGNLLPGLKRRCHDRYLYKTMSRDTDFPAEVLSDSHILVPTDLMRRIGGYDATLLLYHVENDLCKRLRATGVALHHVAAGRVTHIERVTVNKSGLDRVARIYQSDVRRYFRKFYGWLGTALLMAGINLSNVALSIKRRKPQRFLRLFIENPT
jgi:GT2 family glycosyltransferase